MNIKPSGQQVEKWIAEASSEGGKILDPNKLAELAAKWGASQAQQTTADAGRVLEWMRTPNRKPANLAFTDGPERQAAYWIEIAQQRVAQQTTEPEAWSIPEWSKQDDLGGRVPSDVRVALNEAHRAGVRVGMAQQTTDPLGFQIRRAIAAEDELRATKQTLEHAYAALQKVADAQAAIEEPELPEPEAIRHSFDGYGWMYIDNGHGSGWRSGIDKADAEFMYTAAQMHDHYAAGVRAGAAGSQDANEEVVTITVPLSHINSLQVESIKRLVARTKHAHMTDVRIRINGNYEYFEADWLKYVVIGGCA